MMRVAIRADASLYIGSGHVMRCLTLAETLRQNECEVVFICRDLPGNCNSLIDQQGFEVIALPSDSVIGNSHNTIDSSTHWLTVPWEVDAEQTRQILLQREQWHWLIVDHYGIDAAWEKYQMDAVGKILVIDDLADRVHDCDVLIDQNYYVDQEVRYKNKLPARCRQLLGPDYVLLRREFIQQREKLHERNGDIGNILVFFGGVDATNMTEVVIAALVSLNLKDVVINVVIGAANPHRNKLEIVCRNAGMHLHVQVSNMAELMAMADLCIGAGGTATWERCCLGLPTLAWPVAENQAKVLRDAAAAGLVYAPNFTNPSAEEIAIHVRALMQNPLLCAHVSKHSMKIVDGRGVARIVNQMLTPTVTLRPARESDAERVFEWRNDIRIRQFSRDPEELDYHKHLQWYTNVLNNPNRLLLIGSVNGQDCGVLRYDIADHSAEVSIFLVPGQSGKGYGKALLSSGEKYLREARPEVTTITAEVLCGNDVSRKLFASSGYILNLMQYIKRLNQ